MRSSTHPDECYNVRVSMNKRPLPIIAAVGTIVSTLLFLQGLRSIAEEEQNGYISSRFAYLVIGLLIVLPIALWVAHFRAVAEFVCRRADVEVAEPYDEGVWPPPPRR